MNVKRWKWDENQREFVDDAGDECTAQSVVSGLAYDALAARLAEAERLLRQWDNLLSPISATREWLSQVRGEGR